MPKSNILLKGGTLLIHDDKNHVVPTQTDLLVEGQLISKIGEDIQPTADTKVVDCKGNIISPGFIDTHRHCYQTQYKGSHANHTLPEYGPRGNFAASVWSTEDLFWGQLAGALESIEAGTTTIVDHSSCSTTPDHPQAAIQALLSAGLRAVYCFTAARKLVSTEPWKMEIDDFSEENMTRFHALAHQAPYGEGRVHVGYAIDHIYAPAHVIRPHYAALRDAAKGRAKLITTHANHGPSSPGSPSAIQILRSHGLLGPDILLSHANFPEAGDGELYKATGACISSTPNTELQMGQWPAALREDHVDNASIGVDCHSWGVAGIPGQMRMLLQAARIERASNLAAKGLWSRKTGFDVEQVFNLGTLGGAKAAGLQTEVGSLKVGMKADIVVFDSSSPAMLAAAVEDPVAAIVFHSNPSDVDMVIIDGVIRKEGGRLVDVNVVAAPDKSRSLVDPGRKFLWKDIAAKVLESRQSLKEKVVGFDFDKGEEHCIDIFHMSRETLLEAQ